MRIGFDAKRLFHNSTGLGHYSRTLVHHLLNHTDEVQIVLFDSAPAKNDLTLPFFNQERIETLITGSPSWYFRSINANKYINKSKINIYHGLSNELPIIKNKSIPRVVTIHDILYKKFIEDFPWLDRKIYQIKTKNAVKNADCIIAISQATKRDILQTFNVDENKIKVIYQSYDPIFNQAVDTTLLQEVLTRYHLPTEYNYYVGSLTYRKNVKVILEAMTMIKSGVRIPLLIAGDGKQYQDELKKYIISHKMTDLIYFLPNLPRSVVRVLYSGAHTVIYPSLGEGFGLPVLESIAANVPVITSNSSSLPEAGGDVAIYFDPTSADQLASILQNFNRTDYLNRVSGLRIDHLKKFNASAIAKDYISTVYKPLLNL